MLLLAGGILPQSHKTITTMSNLTTTEQGLTASKTEFQAQTKAGKTFDLTLAQTVNGIMFLTPFEGKLRNACGTTIQTKADGNTYIYFDNEFSNERLLGRKIRGWLSLTKGTKQDVEDFKKALAAQKVNEGKAQFDRLLKKDARVYFNRQVTFYGHIYFAKVDGEQLTPFCKELLEQYAEQLDKAKKLPFEREYADFDAPFVSDISVKVLAFTASKLQEEREAKEEASKAEREAKFEEAARTGKKVLLESRFVAGNMVPKRFRHIPDNDMGHVHTWALPNGKVRETFSPSH